MKPERMIKELLLVQDWIEGNHPDCKYDPLDSLRDVIEALSSPCACGGRKPVARFTTDIVVGILDVHVPDGCPDGRASVLVFEALPTEEEGT